MDRNIFKSGEPNAKLRADFTRVMTDRLKDKPEPVDALIPDFSPNCRRLTPGPGYLEASTEENVSYISTPIERFTAIGIVTTDGIERPVDAVICTTGANRDMVPPFPIIGKKGLSVRKAWANDPITYLGLGTPGFPNLQYIQGPNGTGHSGAVPNQMETQVTYIAQLLRKMSQQDIRSQRCAQASSNKLACKPACIPGSASHVNFLRRSPRWEDWDWTYNSPSGNRFALFGNGWTVKEKIQGSDLTPYLKKPEDIDLRLYHEEWYAV